MNKTKLDNYIKIAQTFAERSPDSETKVGAILVSNKTEAVLGAGFNGFVRNAPDSKLPTHRPDKHIYIIHAEVNMICNAARNGVRTDNCFVVCTLSPCIDCLRALYQAGIDTIYYRDTYKDFTKNLTMKDLTLCISNIGKYKKITIHTKGKK